MSGDNDDYVTTDPNEYLLRMACPARAEHPSGNAVSRWVHAEDGKRIIINCNGYIKCTAGHCKLVKDWRWKCGQHGGTYFKSPKIAFPNFLIDFQFRILRSS
jgi:hypothetical protein